MDGARSFASFNVGRELGRGGMGVVYLAELDGREVALKVAAADIPDRERKNFLAEAELMARVAHPSVVELLDSGLLDDGRPYLVMPLLHGQTLGARIARGRLDGDLALRLFAQLASGVSALHEAGIVHRDIKPENVMLMEDEERVVLLDLGIARETNQPASTTTRMNLVRGTPECMAPERFFGTRATPASDVYELTVVLYAMLTGVLPWAEATDPESRLRPRHPSELGIALPVGLGHLLLEGLASRPDRRPSLRELAVRARELEGAALHEMAAPRTTALQAVLPAPTPAAHARSIAPPRHSEAAPHPGLVGVRRVGRVRPMLAVAVAAIALVWQVQRLAVHGPKAAPTSRSELPIETLSSLPVAAAAAPAALEGPVEAPLEAPSATASVSASPAPSATIVQSTASTTPRPVPDATGAACTRLAELYCTPEARSSEEGAKRCASQRALVARMKSLPAKMQEDGDRRCKETMPEVARAVHGAGHAPAEDMPFCKQIVALACSPEAKSTPRGADYCVAVERGFYSGYVTRAPAERAAHDAECARTLPSIAMVMRTRREADAASPGGR